MRFLPSTTLRWLSVPALVGLLSLASTPAGAQWTPVTSLPDGLNNHSMSYWNGFLYAVGGGSYSNSVDDGTNVFFSQVQSGGTIGPWQKTTPLPETIYDHGGVAADGFLYVLTGVHYTLSNGLFFLSSAVYFSKINTNGTLGSWQTTTHLPLAVALLSASVWSNRIYVVGGIDETTIYSNVYSARILADGNLSSWVEEVAIPGGICAHASVANGVLYVLGGKDGNVAFSQKAYFSKINADGTLAGWNQTTPMPEAAYVGRAVAAGGRIYTMGGSDYVRITANFHSAPVNGDGSLGNWSAGPQLPQAVFFHGATVTDSHIFLGGGANASGALDVVYSMPLPPPPAAPALTSQGIGTNGNFQLKLASATNTGFGFLASTNLTGWERIGWGFTGTNGLLSFQDTNTTSLPHRFYRAFWPLP